MGDKDNGVAFLSQKVLQQLSFCFFVERTCCFVENKNRTVAKKAAGNGYALSLTFTQSSALLGTFSIQSFRKVKNKVGTTTVKSLAHLFVCSVKFAYSQIVTNSTTHKGVALRNIRYVATMKRSENVERIIIDFDGSASWFK